MATIYTEADVNPRAIGGEKVGVVGFGNQAHAHALNLKDNGVCVRVGLREGSDSREKAAEKGFVVQTVGEVAAWADTIAILIPDLAIKPAYDEHVAPHLRPGQMIVLAHGFALQYEQIAPPKFVDVALVAPSGPGSALRQRYTEGAGLTSLLAIHHDATGRAHERALSYAWGIAAATGGVIQTSVREETECDLFGEQAVLCGGLPEVVKAGFDTLVEAGFQPEVAYLEVMHQVRLIADLMLEGGLSHMREAISDTAEFGGFRAGEQIVGEPSKQAMREVLADVQSGEFARAWLKDDAAGRPELARYREAELRHASEEVGRTLRDTMAGLQSKRRSSP